jgi:hypothetical protein
VPSLGPLDGCTNDIMRSYYQDRKEKVEQALFGAIFEGEDSNEFQTVTIKEVMRVLRELEPDLLMDALGYATDWDSVFVQGEGDYRCLIVWRISEEVTP